MKVEELYEFIGVGNVGRAPNPQAHQQNSPPIGRAPGYNPVGGAGNAQINAQNCARLYPWQQLILNQLRTGQDIYTIVSPGGGKTSPVVCFWIHEILRINTLQIQSPDAMLGHINRLLFQTNTLEKLIYLVPTRQLAQQTVNDMRGILASIISQLLNWYFANYSTNIRIREHFFRDFITWVFQHFRNAPRGMFARDEIDLLMQDITQSGGQNFISSHRANMLKTFQQVIETATSNFLSSNFLYIQTGGENTRGNPANFPVIVTIYQSADKNPLLGAINRGRLIVCDESHLTQNLDPLHHPQVDQNQAQDIALALYTVLSNKSANCQLAFLSGTQNPASARAFAEFVNNEFRNIRFDISKIQSQGARNTSNIEIISDNSINNNTNIVKKIIHQVQSRDWGNLYILFSTKTMRNIIEEAIKKLSGRNLSSIDQDAKHTIHFTSFIDQKRQQRQQYQNYGDMRISGDNIANSNIQDIDGNRISPEARNIKNPFLRLAVSHGIGFIARNLPGVGTDPKLELDESDKFIIAKLFSEQKLKVLLATDAVGVGVNIQVKTLFIPKIEKFSGNTKSQEQLILRDLAQILHRTGRSATPFSAIHTPEENVQQVMLALNANPDQFEMSQVVPNLRGRNGMRIVYGHMHDLTTRFENWLSRI